MSTIKFDDAAWATKTMPDGSIVDAENGVELVPPINEQTNLLDLIAGMTTTEFADLLPPSNAGLVIFGHLCAIRALVIDMKNQGAVSEG